MANADKIKWSQSAIEELKQRLGQPELVVEEVIDETSEAEIPFPWPITVEEQNNVVGEDGKYVVNLVISWDDIPGAENYEVRVAPIYAV